MVKKIQAGCFFFLFAHIFIARCHADEEFILDDINLNDIVQYETENTPTRTPAVNFIAMALQHVITNPLWQNTMAPKGRDILYLLPHKITALEYGGFACSLFFNMTDKLHVSADSLLDLGNSLEQGRLKTFIIGLLTNLPPDVNVSAQEIVGILPLFKKLTIQERKSGALLQGGFVKGPFTVQLHTSALMSERNFWLSPADRSVITELSNRISPGQEINEQEFYIIKYGMGDTRLKAGVNTLNLTNFQTDVGIEAILPTSRFSSRPQLTVPPVELTPDLINNTPALQNLGVDLLKGLRTYLLNPQLGNGGHFGLGCYFESKIGIFHNLAQIWTRMSYDNIFPAEATRLIMFKKTLNPRDLDPYNPNFPPADPAHDEAILKKVGQFVQEYLFPTAFKVTAQPGGIFNFVTSINVDIKKWRLALGYDFYAQKREQIIKIHNSSHDSNVLRIEDAESSSSMQHKVFTETAYIIKYPKSDLGIGVGGDATVHSTGIGYDWTVYFKLAASF